MNFDPDVVGTRDRIGKFGKADVIGDRAIAVEDKGSHWSIPPRLENSGDNKVKRVKRVNLFGEGVRPLP